jgi:hypothetical protein
MLAAAPVALGAVLAGAEAVPARHGVLGRGVIKWPEPLPYTGPFYRGVIHCDGDALTSALQRWAGVGLDDVPSWDAPAFPASQQG